MWLIAVAFCLLGTVAHGYWVNDSFIFWCGFICCLILYLILLSITESNRSAPYKIPRSIRTNASPPKLIDKNNNNNNNNDYIYTNKFIETSFGDTYAEHWRILNRDLNIKSYHAILIHGFSQPTMLTDSFIPFLLNCCKNDNKIPILSITSYHIYGRGFSDATFSPNTLSLFLSQISDLINSLNINGKLIFFGLSMGAAISIGFTQKYPHRVHKLICLAPAGFNHDDNSWKRFGVKILSQPLIGELLTSFFINQTTVKNGLNKEINVDKHGEEATIAIDKIYKLSCSMIEKHKGYLYSLLSTMRYFPLFNMKIIYNGLYNNKIFNNKQWLFIWGENDTTCPIKNDNILPETKIIKVKGAGHADIVQTYCIKTYSAQLINWIKYN